MQRTFCDWWKTVSNEDCKKVPIEMVDYIWISNIINNSSDENNPTVDEILEWIKTLQIDAIRK